MIPGAYPSARFQPVIFLLVFVVFLVLPSGRRPASAAPTWEEIKGKHFVVYSYPAHNREAANTVLRRAEDYYQKIGGQIGYTRYHSFWTWDERVKIILFPDQPSFAETTGQPTWSQGYASRDAYLFKSRTIVTYLQESNFYNEILPHEVSHLILRDFTANRIPVWFEEGVAQLQEASKSEIAARICRTLIERKKYIPLSVLMNWDVRTEEDKSKVAVFYAQSLSIVEFLLKRYGNAAFGELCGHLKNGKTFEEALRGAYTNNINTITDLENKWITSMSGASAP